MAAVAKKPDRKNWPPALLRRFPKLFWRHRIDQDWDNDWIVLEEEDRDKYRNWLTTWPSGATSFSSGSGVWITPLRFCKTSSGGRTWR
jgi:hypothetical protein